MTWLFPRCILFLLYAFTFILALLKCTFILQIAGIIRLPFVFAEIFSGNNIVDYHGSDFFDEDWFDIIFCLRAEIEPLNKRLEERGYSENKIKNNLESEIFQVSSRYNCGMFSLVPCLDQSKYLF